MKQHLLILAFTAIWFVTGPIAGFSEESRSRSQDTSGDTTAIVAIEEDGFRFMHTERRDENPLQIQLVTSFSSATPYSGAPGAGLHLGYQLTNIIYVGLTSTAFIDGRNQWDDFHSYEYDRDDNDCCRNYDDDREVYGQDGVKNAESELDPIHLLEMRITPWDFGLYFSLGAMHRGRQTSTITFKSEEREIGENTYTTGLEAEVEYEPWSGAALGWGFNHIFECGLTLGLAYNVGLGRQEAEVEVSSTETVSDDDLNYWKKQIKSNEKQIPYLFTMSVGYAF